MTRKMLGKPPPPNEARLTPKRNDVIEEMARLVERSWYQAGGRGKGVRRTLLLQWIRDAKDDYGGDCQWPLCGCASEFHVDCIALRRTSSGPR